VSATHLDAFEELPISGFANIRIPDGADCEQLRLPGTLAVTESFDVGDDLLDIAESVEHPLVDYSGQAKGQSFRSMVSKTWGRMAGSSVWLEKYGVYLTVSRVYFYDKGVRHWPVISFIRAQIHDASWNHLKGYKLEWQGETITFPRALDIPIPYDNGGAFYGPEDPRIAIEEGVPDAEPVVIFNMIEDPKTKIRSMHTFRPFSNYTTKLYIEHSTANMAEKNWSPFFIPSVNATVERKYPNHYIHFLYDYHPLKVLRCHLANGACSWAYQQDFPAAYFKAHKHNDTGGVMRGGTNFVPINVQNRLGLRSFVGFPRTHTDAGCGNEAIYRPELMVLTTNGTQFWVDYSSQPLDFGHSLLTHAQIEDACDSGRILLANSITRVDDVDGQDETTVFFTVADSTVQVARIRGIRQLVQELPQFNSLSWQESDIQWNLNVTRDVMECSIQSATDYAWANTTPAQVEERRKKEEVEEEKKKAAEEKKKEKKLKEDKELVEQKDATG